MKKLFYLARSPALVACAGLLSAWPIAFSAADAQEMLGTDLLACHGGEASDAPNPRMDFWLDGQKRGANVFNTRPDPTIFRAAKEMGIDFIRLAVDKWVGADGLFLTGSTDDYQGIPEADIAELRQSLDDAYAADMPVVLAILRLPGIPYLVLDGIDVDQPLWGSSDYWHQAMSFWHDLAAAIGDHPALVGYSLLDDPRPERFMGLINPSEEKLADALVRARGTTTDLSAFYRCLVDSIRSVDRVTPVLVEPAAVASTLGISFMEPLPDAAALYSVDDFHPFTYTHPPTAAARFKYPGNMDLNGVSAWIDREAIVGYFDPLAAWAAANNIPRQKIIVAEFGVDRQSIGAAEYLFDTITVLNEEGWHWAFYAFREDHWHSMDYELGTQELGELPEDMDQRAGILAPLRDRDAEFADLWEQFSPGAAAVTP